MPGLYNLLDKTVSIVVEEEQHNLTNGQQFKGLVCSVCKGRASVEPTTLQIVNRAAPFLAFLFVFAAFALVFNSLQQGTLKKFYRLPAL